MIVVSTSQILTWQRCQREWHHRYVLETPAPQPAEDLAFGSAAHAALEAHAHGRLPAVPVGGLDAYAHASATALVAGYVAFWTESLPYAAVEEDREMDLGDGVTLRGRLDGRLHDGRIVEHKTTRSDIAPGAVYWERLTTDLQVSAYCLLAGTDTVLYDVLARPWRTPYRATPLESQKRRRDGALYAGQRERDETPTEYGERIADEIASRPERYYRRVEVRRTRDQLVEARDEIVAVAREIAARRDGPLPVYVRSTAACVRYGAACPYLAICSG